MNARRQKAALSLYLLVLSAVSVVLAFLDQYPGHEMAFGVNVKRLLFSVAASMVSVGCLVIGALLMRSVWDGIQTGVIDEDPEDEEPKRRESSPGSFWSETILLGLLALFLLVIGLTGLAFVVAKHLG